MHGDFNIPIMSGTLTSRNSSMNSVVYGGVQQQIGNVPSGRFASNNIPVGLSQISHGSSHGEYSRVANRGGLGVSPFLGSASLRATSSMGNIVGSGNIGMSVGSGGGLYVPGLASHLNMSANNGSGSLGVQGPSRLNNGVLQQGGNSDYGMDFQQKEQIHDNGVPMLSQHFPMGRSPGFNLGEMYSSHHPQQQQHTLFGSLPSGTSLTSINTSCGVSNIGSYEQQFMHPYQYQQIQLQFPLQQMQSINQTNRDLAIRQIQSQQPNPDPYGFQGLLSVIRMSDCDLTLLALGIDLTNMRLDINLSENGHETCFTLV